MISMTTTQIKARLIEAQRIAAQCAYDKYQRAEARRSVKLYSAALTARAQLAR